MADFYFLANSWSYQRTHLYRHMPGRYLYLHMKWRHQLLPVSSKSRKRVHFGSFSGRDFLKTVQQISEKFRVLESLIQGLHFLLYNQLDIFAPLPRNVSQVDMPSFTHYAKGYFPISVAFKSHIRMSCCFTALQRLRSLAPVCGREITRCRQFKVIPRTTHIRPDTLTMDVHKRFRNKW